MERLNFIPCTLKPEAVLRRVASIVTGEARAEWSSDGVWYLGAGYWRAAIHSTDDGNVIELINPGLPIDRVAEVADAVCVILDVAPVRHSYGN